MIRLQTVQQEFSDEVLFRQKHILLLILFHVLYFLKASHVFNIRRHL